MWKHRELTDLQTTILQIGLSFIGRQADSILIRNAVANVLSIQQFKENLKTNISDTNSVTTECQPQENLAPQPTPSTSQDTSII